MYARAMSEPESTAPSIDPDIATPNTSTLAPDSVVEGPDEGRGDVEPTPGEPEAPDPREAFRAELTALEHKYGMRLTARADVEFSQVGPGGRYLVEPRAQLVVVPV